MGVVVYGHWGTPLLAFPTSGGDEFELEGQEVVVSKGQVLRIPSNVPHRAVALEDTLDLDIFSPIRHDWLKKDDEYLRRGEFDRGVAFPFVDGPRRRGGRIRPSSAAAAPPSWDRSAWT